MSSGVSSSWVTSRSKQTVEAIGILEKVVNHAVTSLSQSAIQSDVTMKSDHRAESINSSAGPLVGASGSIIPSVVPPTSVQTMEIDDDSVKTPVNGDIIDILSTESKDEIMEMEGIDSSHQSFSLATQLKALYARRQALQDEIQASYRRDFRQAARRDGTGTAPARLIPLQQEPIRRRNGWDAMLEEMSWMATDFYQERLWRKNVSRVLSSEVAAVVRARNPHASFLPESPSSTSESSSSGAGSHSGNAVVDALYSPLLPHGSVSSSNFGSLLPGIPRSHLEDVVSRHSLDPAEAAVVAVGARSRALLAAVAAARVLLHYETSSSALTLPLPETFTAVWGVVRARLLASVAIADSNVFPLTAKQLDVLNLTRVVEGDNRRSSNLRSDFSTASVSDAHAVTGPVAGSAGCTAGSSGGISAIFSREDGRPGPSSAQLAALARALGAAAELWIAEGQGVLPRLLAPTINSPSKSFTSITSDHVEQENTRGAGSNPLPQEADEHSPTGKRLLHPQQRAVGKSVLACFLANSPAIIEGFPGSAGLSRTTIGASAIAAVHCALCAAAPTKEMPAHLVPVSIVIGACARAHRWATAVREFSDGARGLSLIVAPTSHSVRLTERLRKASSPWNRKTGEESDEEIAGEPEKDTDEDIASSLAEELSLFQDRLTAATIANATKTSSTPGSNVNSGTEAIGRGVVVYVPLPLQAGDLAAILDSIPSTHTVATVILDQRGLSVSLPAPETDLNPTSNTSSGSAQKNLYEGISLSLSLRETMSVLALELARPLASTGASRKEGVTTVSARMRSVRRLLITAETLIYDDPSFLLDSCVWLLPTAFPSHDAVKTWLGFLRGPDGRTLVSSLFPAAAASVSGASEREADGKDSEASSTSQAQQQQVLLEQLLSAPLNSPTIRGPVCATLNRLLEALYVPLPDSDQQKQKPSILPAALSCALGAHSRAESLVLLPLTTRQLTDLRWLIRLALALTDSGPCRARSPQSLIYALSRRSQRPDGSRISTLSGNINPLLVSFVANMHALSQGVGYEGELDAFAGLLQLDDDFQWRSKDDFAVAAVENTSSTVTVKTEGENDSVVPLPLPILGLPLIASPTASLNGSPAAASSTEYIGNPREPDVISELYPPSDLLVGVDLRLDGSTSAPFGVRSGRLLRRLQNIPLASLEGVLPPAEGLQDAAFSGLVRAAAHALGAARCALRRLEEVPVLQAYRPAVVSTWLTDSSLLGTSLVDPSDVPFSGTPPTRTALSAAADTTGTGKLELSVPERLLRGPSCLPRVSMTLLTPDFYGSGLGVEVDGLYGYKALRDAERVERLALLNAVKKMLPSTALSSSSHSTTNKKSKSSGAQSKKRGEAASGPSSEHQDLLTLYSQLEQEEQDWVNTRNQSILCARVARCSIGTVRTSRITRAAGLQVSWVTELIQTLPRVAINAIQAHASVVASHPSTPLISQEKKHVELEEPLRPTPSYINYLSLRSPGLSLPPNLRHYVDAERARTVPVAGTAHVSNKVKFAISVLTECSVFGFRPLFVCHSPVLMSLLQTQLAHAHVAYVRLDDLIPLSQGEEPLIVSAVSMERVRAARALPLRSSSALLACVSLPESLQRCADAMEAEGRPEAAEIIYESFLGPDVSSDLFDVVVVLDTPLGMAPSLHGPLRRLLSRAQASRSLSIIQSTSGSSIEEFVFFMNSLHEEVGFALREALPRGWLALAREDTLDGGRGGHSVLDLYDRNFKLHMESFIETTPESPINTPSVVDQPKKKGQKKGSQEKERREREEELVRSREHARARELEALREAHAKSYVRASFASVDFVRVRKMKNTLSQQLLEGLLLLRLREAQEVSELEAVKVSLSARTTTSAVMSSLRRRARLSLPPAAVDGEDMEEVSPESANLNVIHDGKLTYLEHQNTEDIAPAPADMISGLPSVADTPFHRHIVRRKYVDNLQSVTELIGSHQDHGGLHFSHLFAPPHMEDKFAPWSRAYARVAALMPRLIYRYEAVHQGGAQSHTDRARVLFSGVPLRDIPWREMLPPREEDPSVAGASVVPGGTGSRFYSDVSPYSRYAREGLSRLPRPTPASLLSAGTLNSLSMSGSQLFKKHSSTSYIIGGPNELGFSRISDFCTVRNQSDFCVRELARATQLRLLEQGRLVKSVQNSDPPSQGPETASSSLSMGLSSETLERLRRKRRGPPLALSELKSRRVEFYTAEFMGSSVSRAALAIRQAQVLLGQRGGGAARTCAGSLMSSRARFASFPLRRVAPLPQQQQQHLAQLGLPQTSFWTPAEDTALLRAVSLFGPNWALVADSLRSARTVAGGRVGLSSLLPPQASLPGLAGFLPHRGFLLSPTAPASSSSVREKSMAACFRRFNELVGHGAGQSLGNRALRVFQDENKSAAHPSGAGLRTVWRLPLNGSVRMGRGSAGLFRPSRASPELFFAMRVHSPVQSTITSAISDQLSSSGDPLSEDGLRAHLSTARGTRSSLQALSSLLDTYHHSWKQSLLSGDLAPEYPVTMSNILQWNTVVRRQEGKPKVVLDDVLLLATQKTVLPSFLMKLQDLRDSAGGAAGVTPSIQSKLDAFGSTALQARQALALLSRPPGTVDAAQLAALQPLQRLLAPTRRAQETPVSTAAQLTAATMLPKVAHGQTSIFAHYSSAYAPAPDPYKPLSIWTNVVQAQAQREKPVTVAPAANATVNVKSAAGIPMLAATSRDAQLEKLNATRAEKINDIVDNHFAGLPQAKLIPGVNNLQDLKDWLHRMLSNDEKDFIMKLHGQTFNDQMKKRIAEVILAKIPRS